MENKRTHTPGPWIFNNGSVFQKALSTDGMGERKQIVGGPIGYNSTKFTVQEIDANARLISTAPDLLASARAVADAWTRANIGPIPSELAVALRAAILRAEGSK